MHDPPHPGGIVWRQPLEPLGLKVIIATEGFGVTPQARSESLNGRTGISAALAIQLSKALGSPPETWLGMRTACDLRQVQGRAGEVEFECLVRARDQAPMGPRLGQWHSYRGFVRDS